MTHLIDFETLRETPDRPWPGTKRRLSELMRSEKVVVRTSTLPRLMCHKWLRKWEIPFHRIEETIPCSPVSQASSLANEQPLPNELQPKQLNENQVQKSPSPKLNKKYKPKKLKKLKRAVA